MVIESISLFLSKRLKMLDPDHPADQEVLRWQINIYLNYLGTLILVIVCSLFTGKIIESLLSMFIFIVIRKFSGGVHLRSITACTLLSALIFCVIPLIKVDHIGIFNIIAGTIFLFYGPSFKDEVTIKSRFSNLQLKLICIAIVSSNFIIDSPVLALTFLSQAIFVLPIWGK
ncbi:accessory gene regulator B family protein [Paenibacillus shenyangensis]|uniref:accessory gene regulator B family protein n=1 Tax=Paenibacillus sp. A9 TaxID=1284352 RepID=UPI0003745DDD|nr:accessory gene regulator B family protein [Paenibacillus sp. A9]